MEYFVKIDNKPQWLAIEKFLKSQGNSWPEIPNDSNYRTEAHRSGHLKVTPGALRTQATFYDARPKSGDVVLSFDQWAAVNGVATKKEDVTIRLNRDYSATISFEKESVAIGCQTISFDKVRDVYVAIQ